MGFFSTLQEKLFGRLRRNVSESSEHLVELKNTFGSRLENFKSNRTKADQEMVTADFSLLLHAWGIEDVREIPQVCSELRWRLPLFILPVLLLLIIAIWQDVALAWLVFGLCAVPCLFGLATTLWRISILKNRQFMPFWQWLTAFLRRN